MDLRSQIRELVKSRYKDEFGNPFVLTDGQIEIFSIIFGRKYPFVQTITYTQYGKTDVCSLAVLTRITTFPERWAIVAPTDKKAKIMMRYLIGHIFDNEYTKQKFAIGKNESLERVRRERSKDRLTFRISGSRIGEVFIVSAQQKSVKDVLDALMGFGAQNVILDESSLIDNQHYAGVIRMLGGYTDFFLFEIGNPFRRNHFLETSRDPDYHHVLIDYNQGVAEGRLSSQIIEKAKKQPFFDILYGCNFPGEEVIDSKGWMVLITESELKNALVEEVQHFGVSKYGVDVAGGGRNYSVVIHRSSGFAEIISRDRSDDTAGLAGRVLTLKKEELKGKNYSGNVEIEIDKIGVGKGAFDVLRQQTNHVVGVAGGDKADEEKRFFNKRSENNWRIREWILAGGKLKGKFEDWKELLSLKYKIMYDRKIQLIQKDKLLGQGIPSPDVADALANTFSTPDSPIIYRNIIEEELRRNPSANKNKKTII